MHQVSWKRQLILAITLFVLGLGTYWLQYKYKPQKDQNDEEKKKVFTLKTTPVEKIRISDGQQTYELDCLDLSKKLCKPGDPSKWQLSEPVQGKADDTNANSMVGAMNSLAINETIDLKDETPQKKTDLLKEYGLDPQSLAAPTMHKIEVDTGSGITTLYVGQTHPVGEAFFAAAEKTPSGQKPSGKIDDSTIFLIPSYFKVNFQHDLTYWRNKKILTLTVSDIEAFHMTSSKGDIQAERKDGRWMLHSKDEDVPGDSENIEAILSGLTYLSAKSFPADSKSSAQGRAVLKGAKKISSVTLQMSKKPSDKEAPAPVTLTLYEAKDKTATKVYAVTSDLDPVFEVDATAKDKVAKELKDLRLAKILASMERYGATHLEFSGKPLGSTPIVLTRKNGIWTSSGNVDSAKIQKALDKLSGNRIKEFLQGPAIPTGEDDGIILSLGDDKEPQKIKFAFWKKDGKLYSHDLLSKRKEAYLMDPTVADDLPWSSDFFKKSAATPAPQKAK